MVIECVLCFSHDDIPNILEEEKNAETHVFLESVSGLIGIHLDLWIRICNSARIKENEPPKEKKKFNKFHGQKSRLSAAWICGNFKPKHLKICEMNNGK